MCVLLCESKLFFGVGRSCCKGDMRVLQRLQRKTWLSNYLQDQSDESDWRLLTSNPHDKNSQALLIMPAWVSRALQIYQMKLIGNTLGPRSWETCLSGVTFLLRFPDSLQRLQPRWKMREYVLGGGRRHIEGWMMNTSTHPLTVAGHVLK